MKICILATSFPRWAAGDGANGNFVYQIARALSGQVRVAVVAPHDRDALVKEDIDGIEVRRFRYVLPSRLQRLAYGEKGIIENLSKSTFVKAQVPLFMAAFTFEALLAARG